MAYNLHSSNSFTLTDCGAFKKKSLLIWYNNVVFSQFSFQPFSRNSRSRILKNKVTYLPINHIISLWVWKRIHLYIPISYTVIKGSLNYKRIVCKKNWLSTGHITFWVTSYKITHTNTYVFQLHVKVIVVYSFVAVLNWQQWCNSRNHLENHLASPPPFWMMFWNISIKLFPCANAHNRLCICISSSWFTLIPWEDKCPFSKIVFIFGIEMEVFVNKA